MHSSSSKSSSPKSSSPKSDIITWKYIWNDILSDPDFRNWIVDENLGYYQIFKNKNINNDSEDKSEHDVGTIYMKFGKLGHYIAYKLKKNNKMTIFDSSYPDGTYGDCLDEDYIDSIRYNFDNCSIVFDETYGTPQRLDDDSFCQTWSLAYLSNYKKLKSFLKDSKNDPINSLFNICKFIINLPIFEEICIEQKNWIEKNLKINKASKKWTSEYLLEYSRNFDYDDFEKLFK